MSLPISEVVARQMGHAFAEAVRAHRAVQKLWAASAGDRVDLWLLTTSTDAETERDLYSATAPLYEQFPGVDLHLHLLNPNPELYGPFDPTEAIPAGTVLIPLHSK